MNHGIGISGQASLTYYKIVFRDRVPLNVDNLTFLDCPIQFFSNNRKEYCYGIHA